MNHREFIKLSNLQFELTLMPGIGLGCHLVHRPSGTTLADGTYSYSFGTPVFAEVRQESTAVVLLGMTETGIAIEHRFSVNEGANWIEEQLTLRNTNPHPLMMRMRCGFVLAVRSDTLKGYTFTAVPFRREAYGHRKQYADYSLEQILREGRRSRQRSDPDYPYHDPGFLSYLPELQRTPRQTIGAPLTAEYAAEGWVFTDGERGFLISKYSQSACEYAVLDRIPLKGEVMGFRWGGMGSAEDDWDHTVCLSSGAQRHFGVGRLTAFEGDLSRGYYAFRSEMEARGHRVPNDFNPPLHWNELFDNQLYWNGEWKNKSYSEGTLARMLSGFAFEPKARQDLYTLTHMRAEARKAQAMGCEALYLDPGWDTPQSSKLWDAERLGRIDSFVDMLKNEYGGLGLSLHTPLAGWHDAKYDKPIPGSEKMDEAGHPTPYPCGASQQYLEETARRLRLLADEGVCFFMFDGYQNTGECWNRNHDHSIPLKQSEYVDAVNRLARMVHATHPHVLIEMHARGTMMGPPVAPCYYGHGMSTSGVSGFDEIWGFELMVNSMGDLLSGNSMALYYYNLAYSMPLYLHIDLRTDNIQCVAFWWNASTCRHLGIGGTHEDPEVVAAQRAAIATYLRLKRYFSAGAFYGIDELTHVHASRDGRSAVINCFNLTDQSIEREICFEPAQYGLEHSKNYCLSGASYRRVGGAYIARASIPARGHTLIEVQ